MKIAIQGHLIRRKEVIQVLESLGGKNTYDLVGDNCYAYYYIYENDIMILHNSIGYKLYTLEEFEQEFPFKVGDKVTHPLYDKPFTIIELNPTSEFPYVLQNEEAEFNVKSKILTKYKKKKTVETRTINLSLDKAKEWYKKGGELKEVALQAFTEKELITLPRSWEAYCRKYKSVCLSTRNADIPLKYDALIKLEQLRNCWWNGWEPEWSDCEKHVIKWEKDDLIIFTARRVHAFLVFPTKEMAYVFLKCFRDLIEKAGDLI